MQTERDWTLIIGGDRFAGEDGAYDIVNPATETVVGTAPEASVAQAEQAAAAAAEAFTSWSRTTPEERAALLDHAADLVEAHTPELIPLAQAETGATQKITQTVQVPQTTARLRRYARGALEPTVLPLAPTVSPASSLAPAGVTAALAQRLPVGVVTCITSYNFPLVNMAGKIGPALAMGNTVIVKPAPQDPLAVIRLVELLHEAGFPPGVVNVLTGEAVGPAEALTTSPDVDMVSFTGSTAVGQRIGEVAGRDMKRLLLELGGKGACIVYDDADLGKAMAGIASVWGFHSGQICTAPTRVIVHRKVHDELVGMLGGVAGFLKVGDPLEAETHVGPLITATHRDRVESHIAAGMEEGAEVAAGGGRPDLDRGFYVNPTLLVGCTNEMRVSREEIFGPVVVVVPFDDDDEAIALANDSDYGLYDYVYTESTPKALEVAGRLRAGNVGINTLARNPETPFGGFKKSGVGRDGGSFGLHAYSELQSVVWPG